MYKAKKAGDAASSIVWDAHVAKAASSPIHALEYKKSNYVLVSDKVIADKIRRGDGVSENYLKGLSKERLMQFQDLTEEDFQKYK
tara:strand:+ start:5737 stop:5991 length:255 start_codon:yes stop_codon:yes gene_type:complete